MLASRTHGKSIVFLYVFCEFITYIIIFVFIIYIVLQTLSVKFSKKNNSLMLSFIIFFLFRLIVYDCIKKVSIVSVNP